ncbi:MAG: hypothetical protein A3I00_01465 [Betaproteobacteria bacterium RIFCSPLOWO2_02_FULL_64_12]|nr:MAG: hypothetical protein A3I00_01465 [Betaproteobacteria bacterium RIFCSPLOWO2_02_FULL_64_12]
MENRAYALAAGLFTLLLGAALVAVAFWFSKDDMSLVPYVVTTTRSVSGLKTDAAVRYRGVEVGRVESIRIEPGSEGRILIRIGVSVDTPVTKGTYARLGFQGVTGLAFISLDDDGSSPVRLSSHGRELAQIQLLPSIVDSGEDLLSSLGEMAERVGSLLGAETQAQLKKTLGGVEQASRRAALLAEKLEPGVEGVPGLMADARGALTDARSALVDTRGAVGRADQLMANLNDLARKIEERMEALNRVAKSVEEVGAAARSVNDETLPRLHALVEELSRESRALDRVLNTLNERPRSLVFGNPPGSPGPGETGFSAGGAK